MRRLKQLGLFLLEQKELIKRRFINPEKYIKTLFYQRMGYPLSLEHPRTYSEKLQWLKLYWHLPILTRLVDKYAVKDFVRERIGDKHIIPTIAVWDKVSDINWDVLPDQFVLKCTHDSGGLVICKDKSKLNKEAAIRKLHHGLKQEYYKVWREWPYKNVKKRIHVAEYLQEQSIEKSMN